MPDPVAWIEIEQGWSVVSSDGVLLGSVASVTGDRNADIFDGLAVSSGAGAIVYVAGEQVGPIVSGEVTLRITAAAAANLPPFTAPPPEEPLRLPRASLGSRLSRMLRRR